MKNVSMTVIAALTILLFPYLSYSQQAEAPVYKDGDWWKVKVEFEHLGGLSRSGECYEDYSEYLVKIQEGKPRVYGISGTSQEEIECPPIESQLLGTGPNARGRLKFPLSLGKSWTTRFMGRRRWRYPDFKVLAWEKVKTPKGDFNAFKIRREISGSENVFTYYYAPKVKSIVLLKGESRSRRRKVTLVDFNVE